MKANTTMRQLAKRVGLVTGNGPLSYLPKDVQQQAICPQALIRGFHSGSKRSFDAAVDSRRSDHSRRDQRTTLSKTLRRGYSSKAQAEHAIQTAHDEPTLPDQFRSVMRTLTNPVVVCTTTALNSSHRAMTMSSFTSLSPVTPPLIMFNIQEPSRTADAIAETGTFNIHILSGDQHGQALADYFTKGNANTLLGEGQGPRILGGAAPPVLEDSGVLWVLKCRLAPREGREGDFIRVRDHNIVVGEVLEMLKGSRDDAGGSPMGLAYADRRYRQVGAAIPSK